MQAIVTRYIGPTDTRGSRVKAKCDAGSVTLSWEYGWGVEQNHRVAAEVLRVKLGWGEVTYGAMVAGSLPGNTGYVFVFVGRD